MQIPYKGSLKANLSLLNDIQNRILVLPSSANLKNIDQNKIIEVINSFFKN